MASILVTGGAGAVGHPLCLELKRAGHDVTSADIRHQGAPGTIRCDVAHFRQLESVLQSRRFDLVYHTAGEFGRWNGEAYYENLWLTNAVGTKNVLELSRRYKYRVVVFSSSEIYGDFADLMDEDVPDRFSLKQLNDYAISKWVNELQAINASAMHGTEIVRVRLFNTYGPGEFYHPYRSVICKFIYSALKGLPYTVYVNHHRSNSYTDDVVKQLAVIAEKFRPGEVYNIGTSVYHDMKAVSDMVLAAVGRPDDLVTYKDREPFTTVDKRVTFEKARRELGEFQPTPLDVGIMRTVNWMKGVYEPSTGWEG